MEKNRKLLKGTIAQVFIALDQLAMVAMEGCTSKPLATDDGREREDRRNWGPETCLPQGFWY